MDNQSFSGIGATQRHAQIILDSYKRLLGRPLLTLAPGEREDTALFECLLIVLSHGLEEDPVLNYGNRRALALWEMDWEAFTATPSRLTAEPMLRAERQRFLEEVALKGYVDTYKGIRISRTGTKFEIQEAIVFNLTDEDGARYGQAAVFAAFSPV